MEASEVDPGLGDQGNKPGDEVHRLENHMRGAIAVRRFELVAQREEVDTRSGHEPECPCPWPGLFMSSRMVRLGDRIHGGFRDGEEYSYPLHRGPSCF
jgi:hypothetical protein